MQLGVGLQEVGQSWHRPTRNAHITQRQVNHFGCESERVKNHAHLLRFSATLVEDQLRDFALWILKYLL